MKDYFRFIRINGKLVMSPRFKKKVDADKWYEEMRRKKQFLRDGILVDSKNGIKFIEYARVWLRKRQKNYPAPTWMADEQRLRDYILPHLSERALIDITAADIKELLTIISEEGYLKEGFQISIATRTRVKALLSAIFGDALNENPPFVRFNPVLGLKFKDRRIGRKKPRVLSNYNECLDFLKAAKKLGSLEYTISAFFLMTGLRKQELIALKWSSIDFSSQTIHVSEKYEQATNSIVSGTKAGEEEVRSVPASRELFLIAKAWKAKTKFKEENDFVFCKIDGSFIGARDISRIIESIRDKAEVNISAHGLRHTFGREFAANTGNLKALQAILGHASSATTDIYSELAGDRIKRFSEAVVFKTESKRQSSDSTVTAKQKRKNLER